MERQSPSSRLMFKREVKISVLKIATGALLAVEAVDKKARKEQEGAKLREFHELPFLE